MTHHRRWTWLSVADDWSTYSARMSDPKLQVLEWITRKKAVKLATLRRHFSTFQLGRILRELEIAGKIQIQQSGFAGDNLHHGKLVVRISQEMALTNCLRVHPSNERS